MPANAVVNRPVRLIMEPDRLMNIMEASADTDVNNASERLFSPKNIW